MFVSEYEIQCSGSCASELQPFPERTSSLPAHDHLTEILSRLPDNVSSASELRNIHEEELLTIVAASGVVCSSLTAHTNLLEQVYDIVYVRGLFKNRLKRPFDVKSAKNEHLHADSSDRYTSFAALASPKLQSKVTFIYGAPFTWQIADDPVLNQALQSSRKAPGVAETFLLQSMASQWLPCGEEISNALEPDLEKRRAIQDLLNDPSLCKFTLFVFRSL